MNDIDALMAQADKAERSFRHTVLIVLLSVTFGIGVAIGMVLMVAMS